MRQWTIVLLELAPMVLGGAVALGVWIGTRRHRTSLGGPGGVLAAVGGLIPVAASAVYSDVAVTPQLLGLMGPDVSHGFLEAQFVIPLSAGLLALAVLSVRGRRVPAASSAGIARRTAFTFLPRGWMVALAAAALAVIALSLAAGLASAPDQAGHYTLFKFRAGTFGAGSTIYGWFYSVPALLLLLVLMGTVWAVLAFIARPPMSDAIGLDAGERRTRSRNIAAVVTGAMAFELASILESLARTSMVQVSFATDTSGWVTVGTSFAALSGFLSITGFLAAGLGAALCVSVALTAVPTAARARQTTVTTTP